MLERFSLTTVIEEFMVVLHLGGPEEHAAKVCRDAEAAVLAGRLSGTHENNLYLVKPLDYFFWLRDEHGRLKNKPWVNDLTEIFEKTREFEAEYRASHIQVGQEETQTADGPLSEHCASFRWRGKVFSLTPKAALMIKALWEARDHGKKPGLPLKELRKAAGIIGKSKLRDTFKHVDGWRDLVEYVRELRIWRFTEPQ